ncbi:MAG: ABC transporter ATP-binding protein [Solirubrobacteraceae bacterium]
MNAIAVDDVRKRYRGATREALAGVSFAVPRGEIFGLLGTNGVGKTTLIGVLTTRVRATAGRAWVDGVDVSRQPVLVKSRIAIVPQRPTFDRALNVTENLLYHAAYFGVGRRERRRLAEEVLERFGLREHATASVDALSGGLAQRLQLARALMHRPSVLFVDEPSSGLDPQSRLLLWDQLEDLRADGVTLLVTTHDLTEADRLCDRVAILHDGRIVALDAPAALRAAAPGSGGLELVIDAAGDPASHFGLFGDVRCRRAGGGWAVRLPAGVDAAAAVSTATGAGLELHALRRVEASLEDVFVHITGRELS